MPWGRRNVKDLKGDLFYAGAGDPDADGAIGADLALLARCNATLITRGTFSMFASVLNGGQYYTEYGMIVPDEVMNPDLEEYQQELIL